MAKIVKVDDVVQEMGVSSDNITVYLNKLTGEFIPVSDEEMQAAEADSEEQDLADWQREILPKIREVLESKDCIALPDQFEIHEWAIMRDFSSSVEKAEVSERLLNAISGPGAFRYFRDELCVIGLEEEWYRFREGALKRIAIDWLEANSIPYERGSGDA